jgi:predicted membrane protein
MVKRSSSSIFGIIVIIIGIFLLGKNLDLPFTNFFSFGDLVGLIWPMFFIAWGVEALNKKNYVVGALFTLIGFHFLIDKVTTLFPALGILSKIVWPALIIIVGLYVMASPTKTKPVKLRGEFSDRSVVKSGPTHSKSSFDSHVVGSTVIIHPEPPKQNSRVTVKESSTEHIQDEAPKHGVKLKKEPLDEKPDTTQVNEPIEIPLRPETSSTSHTTAHEAYSQRQYATAFNSKKLIFSDKDFKDGENTLDLTCTFGDIKVYLPPTVDVVIDGSITLGDLNFFGKKFDGIASKFSASMQSKTPSGKRLLINASVVFGDIKIKYI